MKKTALVIGATGLVGKQLVALLQHNEQFDSIIVFVRRATGWHHPKLREHIISFDDPTQWQHLVKGDVLFSCLGTTLKQAGSKAAQHKVDYTYQYQFATAAAANQVPVYVLVSAAGVSERSMIFYNRMKAALERDVQQLSFQRIHIIQPGLLSGERAENRTGEQAGFYLLRFLNRLGLAKKYRPIDGSIVARAMIQAALQQQQGVSKYTLDHVFTLADTQ